MKIVVAVRCYNEEKNIERFLRGYDFADTIVCSDGGSTDGSVELIKERQKSNHKIQLINFDHHVMINGYYFNEDAPHMNFVLDAAKALDPSWLIFDDMDCVPNSFLRENARNFLEYSFHKQVNVFRLYLWGDDGKYFPKMNNYFDSRFTSLWAWRPSEINIRADESIRHGTLIGLDESPLKLDTPACLLHRSWHPNTISAKIERYNKLGLPMQHPMEFAGELEDLPEWATED